jgi:hypothetical protein
MSVLEMSSFPWNLYPYWLFPEMVMDISALLAMNEMLH